MNDIFSNKDPSTYQVGLAIARGGSILAAADILNVSHQTIRRRLEAMESSLDVQLFERLSSGYVPTQAGGIFLETASEVEQLSAQLESRMKGMERNLTGKLTVSTGYSITLEVFQRNLGNFHKHYPEIELEIVESGRILDLSLREADVGIRPETSALSQRPNLVRRHLCEFSFAVYGSARYLDTHGTPKSIPELKDHSVIMPQERGLYYFDPIMWFTKQFTPKRIPLVTNNLRTMQNAVKQDMGLAILPCLLADEDSGLVRVFSGDREFTQSLWLYTHREIRFSPKVQSFIDYFCDSIKADEDKLLGVAA